jgi:hypothetical protein
MPLPVDSNEELAMRQVISVTWVCVDVRPRPRRTGCLVQERYIAHRYVRSRGIFALTLDARHRHRLIARGSRIF